MSRSHGCVITYLLLDGIENKHLKFGKPIKLIIDRLRKDLKSTSLTGGFQTPTRVYISS